jgi:phosphoethanolamine N-methyltransferase
MTDDKIFYTDDLIANLQYRYGDGYLSPGGVDELRLMCDGVPIAGRAVLDVGCGIGGYDIALVRDLGAAHVTGTDIEAGVLAEARERASAVGLGGHLRFVRVDPGPLPFDDGVFDVVFSKDAIVHLPEKAQMLREMSRVLVPGGALVLGDWFGSDAPMTPEMRAWATEGDETFAMDSLSRMAEHARAAGFTAIATRDRADWFRDFCRDEVERLEGPLFDTYAARFGDAQARRSVANARTRLTLAEQGQLRPGHLTARKPA